VGHSGGVVNFGSAGPRPRFTRTPRPANEEALQPQLTIVGRKGTQSMDILKFVA
jgi:hypothetical protein